MDENAKNLGADINAALRSEIAQLRERLDAVEKENERLKELVKDGCDDEELIQKLLAAYDKSDSHLTYSPIMLVEAIVTHCAQLRLSNERMREALKKLRRRDFPDDEEALWDEIQSALTAESGTEVEG